MEFNDKLHIDPIHMEKIQQLGEGAAADAISTIIKVTKEDPMDTYAAIGHAMNVLRTYQDGIIKNCDQAVAESLPCHYCGATEWSIDPITRRTTCCHSL